MQTASLCLCFSRSVGLSWWCRHLTGGALDLSIWTFSLYLFAAPWTSAVALTDLLGVGSMDFRASPLIHQTAPHTCGTIAFLHACCHLGLSGVLTDAMILGLFAAAHVFASTSHWIWASDGCDLCCASATANSAAIPYPKSH